MTGAGEQAAAAPRRVLVAVPAYQEQQTVADVVREVRDALPDVTVLVVDDGSSDATAPTARAAGAEVLVLPFNVGVGGAMRTAFVYARRHGFDTVVQVDADGQHDPADVVHLVAALDHASVVVGSRFEGEGRYVVRGPRRWAMKVLAASVSRVAGTRLSDTTSGLRASDARAVALFADRYPAEYLGDTVESLVIAARAGLPVAQVPVVMRERQGGRPSTGPVRSTLYAGRAMLSLLIALTRRSGPAAEEV